MYICTVWCDIAKKAALERASLVAGHSAEVNMSFFVETAQMSDELTGVSHLNLKA